MGKAPATCWNLIVSAAAGDAPAREQFVHRYHECVRAYLQHRWAGSPMLQAVDDAVQEVFLCCLRERGALSGARPDAGNGFRAYLYGVVRNVARGLERRHQREPHPLPTGAADPPADDASLSRTFDRTYALLVLRQAADHLRQRALQRSAAHQRRVELLRLRFDEGMPIRNLAKAWQVDAKWLHHQYEQASKEFLVALRHALGLPERASAAQLAQQCQELLALLRG